jgi:glycosyltransferase involved in cell wall biosynthesis
MRVLVINQYFYPDIAATSQILTDLCIELNKDFDVSILCGRPSYNPIEHSKYKIFRLYYYNNCKILRVWNSSFSRKTFGGRITNYFTFMLFAMFTSLFMKKRDVIFSMTDPPFVGFIAYIINKLKKIPYVLTLQDVHPDIELYTGLLRKNLVINIWKKVNKLIFDNAEKIVVLGSSMKNYIMNEYNIAAEKIEIIHNYIDDEIITPQPKRNKFLLDKEFKDKFIVMHSGNMGLNQNLHIIIESAKILSYNKDIAFVFIGDGASKNLLVSKANSYGLRNIYFLPYQPKEELPYSLSAADIHLITLTAGLTNYIFPSKLYGIMAVGRPIIACIDKDSDIDKIINEAKCGICIEPNNPERLADAILKLYNKKEMLIEMGNNARSYLEKNFRRIESIRRYKELLAKCVSH